jgi:hypothetical protein
MKKEKRKFVIRKAHHLGPSCLPVFHWKMDTLPPS